MQVKRWKTPLPKEQSEGWAFSPAHPDFRGAYPTNRLPEMKQALAGLRPDYAALLAPHAKAHGALYNRVAIDLGGGADRRLTSEELLARAARDGMMSKALAERLYNACRYLIICSSGDTPPNLQGIWTGTWSPAWSGDYTLDSNLQLEVQSMMSCNMPELMESYFNLVDSWMPDWRLNAKKIYGFRGVVSNARASNVCLLLHWGGTGRANRPPSASPAGCCISTTITTSSRATGSSWPNVSSRWPRRSRCSTRISWPAPRMPTASTGSTWATRPSTV